MVALDPRASDRHLRLTRWLRSVIAAGESGQGVAFGGTAKAWRAQESCVS
jgi:hypothetical protein